MSNTTTATQLLQNINPRFLYTLQSNTLTDSPHLFPVDNTHKPHTHTHLAVQWQEALVLDFLVAGYFDWAAAYVLNSLQNYSQSAKNKKNNKKIKIIELEFKIQKSRRK